jgi:hypothetical protein
MVRAASGHELLRTRMSSLLLVPRRRSVGFWAWRVEQR